MVDFNFNFGRPKRNILKLGKVFDLSNIATDEYEMIILASIDGLTIDDLDNFSTLTSKESDPSQYTKPNVPLQLNETTTGYQINVSGNSIAIPISNATVAGLLIVKSDTGDILAADFEETPIIMTKELTVTFQEALWEISLEQINS